jgi:hypothetical protein
MANLIKLIILLLNIFFELNAAKEFCPTNCTNDYDCRNCFYSHNCTNSECLSSCETAKEGNDCSSDSDCNTSCGLEVKLYCADKKCSNQDNCANDLCKMNEVALWWIIISIITFVFILICCKVCCIKFLGRYPRRYSSFNDNSNWSITSDIPISHSNQTGYYQYNAMNISDAPPPYSQFSQ